MRRSILSKAMIGINLPYLYTIQNNHTRPGIHLSNLGNTISTEITMLGADSSGGSGHAEALQRSSRSGRRDLFRAYGDGLHFRGAAAGGVTGLLRARAVPVLVHQHRQRNREASLSGDGRGTTGPTQRISATRTCPDSCRRRSIDFAP